MQKAFIGYNKVYLELEDEDYIEVHIMHKDKYITLIVHPSSYPSDRYNFEIRDGEDAVAFKKVFYDNMAAIKGKLVELKELAIQTLSPSS